MAAPAVQDLALDPATWDLDLSNNDLYLLSGGEAVKQNAGIRMKFFLGEWFLSPGEGIDYYGKIFKKSPNLSEVRDEFVNALVTAPGITEVVALVLTMTDAIRKLNVGWAVNTDLTDDAVSGNTTPPGN